MTASAALCAALLLVAGCSGYRYATPPKDFRIEPRVDFSGKHVVVFLVDALGQDKFDELLAEGKLPQIKRYLVDRGRAVRPTVTTLPANTCSAFPAALTGRFAGHTGVPADAWFDRSTLVTRRYDTAADMHRLNIDTRARFIYEYLKDDTTAVVLTQANRGCTRFYENAYSAAPLYGLHQWTRIDRLTTARFYQICEESADRGSFPTLTVLYYMSGDPIGREYGPDSDRADEAFATIDEYIGEVCQALEKNGQLDKILLVLTGDHGMQFAAKHRTLDVAGHLETLGVRTAFDEWLNEDDAAAKRRKVFDRYRAVVTVTGARSAFIYLRKPGPEGPEAWNVRCEAPDLKNCPAADGAGVNLLTHFARRPEVGLVTWRENADTVGVLSSAGEARIERSVVNREKRYAYRVVDGRDPLGYPAQPTTPRDSLAWLAATVGTSHPDLVAQLPELFDSPRVGDIVLFASDGWAFASSKEQVGHHGGISRREMLVPLVFAGPGSERIAAGPSRTVDLVPTLLDTLNRSAPAGDVWSFDGRSLYGRTP